MKAIILAAGYATRLYPLTKDKAKALLPLGEQPIINYIVDQIEEIEEIDTTYVISNTKFYQQFVDWAESTNYTKEIKIVDDGTDSDETKLGAIGDLQYLVETENVDDDIMVIAGDNYFTYSLKDFYNFFKEKGDSIAVAVMDDREDLKRMGVAVVDEDSKVIGLEEKPQNPMSNIAVYATYIYQKETLPLLKKYLDEGNNPDAPGFFPTWLYKQKDVYAYMFDGESYDIGLPSSYKEVNEIVERSQK